MADKRSFPTGVGVDEARSRIVEIATERMLPAEHVTLEAAGGRVLAIDICAPFDVPGFVNSAMDGFAVRAEDLPASAEKPFRLLGQIFAGGDMAPEVLTDTCVRVTTGAPLPRGADTVVMKENTRADGEHILIAPGTASAANVRPAGEDYATGDLALKRGMRLTPARVGVIASFGFAEVKVARRPRAVLFTTGDELVAPGKPLGFGHIYDSNRFSLGGLLQQHDVALLRHARLRDDPIVLRDALLRAGADADIIFSSGGVSAGEADFLPRLLAEIGEVYFWKVRMRPGMPFLFGKIGGALLFALPGNPVSGVATFLSLVKPALQAMSGAESRGAALRARLRQAIRKRHARTEFQRARLECDAGGILWATPLEKQGSGMLRGVAEADALVVLPEAVSEFAAGHVVDVLPLPGWPG
ncbi:MAG: molybdopterin molybdotransferase MoeA [Rudaea sp.]|nr:molybdopterin molybdotransferase MoeA [Rudaea sp.]